MAYLYSLSGAAGQVEPALIAGQSLHLSGLVGAQERPQTEPGVCLAYS